MSSDAITSNVKIDTFLYAFLVAMQGLEVILVNGASVTEIEQALFTPPIYGTLVKISGQLVHWL